MDLLMPCSGGGQLTRRPHALSYDGETVVVCNAERLCVYSSITGERIFDLRGHLDEVTGICLHPRSKNQIYSCSKDGSVRLWNLDDGSCIATWAIPDKLPIESMVIVGDVAYISYFWRGNEAGRALAFDLIKGEAQETRVKLSIPRPIVSSEDFSDRGESVVATFDRHTILVWEAASFGRRSPLALHHTKAFTCVTVSHDGTKIAAGDVSGRILIWHDIREGLSAKIAQEEERKKNKQFDENDEHEPWTFTEPPAATVHWHAHPVGCVAFSRDGRYLLSGGEEAVLVLWDVLSGSRGYLPRLGGPVIGISSCKSNMSRYCLRQADNTVRIVNIASMSIECSIHGVRPIPNHLDEAPLVLEPCEGHAVVVGPQGILQFYNVCRDVHIDRLQLTRRNIVSMAQSSQREFGIDKIDPTIQSLVFNQDASVLISVESHPNVSGKSSNQILKFWDRCTEESKQYGNPYRLNTVAENPHRNSEGDHYITGVAINDARYVVGTSSNSGEFSLWATESADSGRKSWRKLAVISGHRGDPLTAIAFSNDGSLVAVSGDQAASGGVSIWDTSTCLLIGEFPGAFTRGLRTETSKQDHLFFIPKTSLLVFICSLGITVYNVLSLTIVWSIEIAGVTCVASDLHSSHWAVILDKDTRTHRTTKNEDISGTLILFEGGQMTPKAAWLIPGKQSSIVKPRSMNTASNSTCHCLNSSNDERYTCNFKVAFIPPNTKAYERAEPLSIPGCSPIMVFSQDREFSLAISPEIASVEQVSDIIASRNIPESTKRDGNKDSKSGYSNIFGSSAKAGEPMSIDASYFGNSAIGRNVAIFDAPSHALPPMTALCNEFLETLLDV